MEGENSILDGSFSTDAAQSVQPVVTPEVVSVAPPPVMPEVVATSTPFVTPEVVTVSEPVLTPAGEIEQVVTTAPEAVVESVAPITEVAAESVTPVAEAVVDSVAPAAEAAESPVLQVQSQSDYFASAFRYEPVTPEAAQQDFTQAAEPAQTGTVFTPRSTAPNASYGSSYGQGNYAGGYNQSSEGYGSTGYNGGYGGTGNIGYNGGYGSTGSTGYNGNYGGSGTGINGTTAAGYGAAGGYANSNTNYMQPGYRSSSDEYSTPDYYGGVYNNDPFASYYDDEVPQRANNGLAIGALICGIASLVMACSYTGFIPGIIAIILGIRGANQCDNKSMARTGMILGICGCVIGLFVIGAFALRLVDEIYSLF